MSSIFFYKKNDKGGWHVVFLLREKPSELGLLGPCVLEFKFGLGMRAHSSNPRVLAFKFFFYIYIFTLYNLDIFWMNLIEWCLNNNSIMLLFLNDICIFYGTINNFFKMIIYESNMYNFLTVDNVFFFCLYFIWLYYILLFFHIL